jgi:hypothetical protein
MENDKTAGWLVIISFLAFSLAIMFAVIELNELTDDTMTVADKLFIEK